MFQVSFVFGYLYRYLWLHAAHGPQYGHAYTMELEAYKLSLLLTGHSTGQKARHWTQTESRDAKATSILPDRPTSTHFKLQVFWCSGLSFPGLFHSRPHLF